MERKVTNLLWVLISLIAVVAAISIILSFVFGGGSSSVNYGPFGMMGYGYYGMGIVMPIIGIVSVIFVIVFIYFLLDSARDSNAQSNSVRYSEPGGYRSPEDIARERYARGEITEEELRKIEETLRK